MDEYPWSMLITTFLLNFNMWLASKVSNARLTASGVSGFRSMLKQVESKTSLRRNITIEDVGNTAAFLGSDLSAGMTGEILYVDAGYRNLGMNFDME